MIVQSVEKNSEFTYGVHAQTLASIVPDNAFTLLSQALLKEKIHELDKGVMGSVRALNNLLELFRQGIGYGLSYKVDYSTPNFPKLLFAVYKRNKKNNEGQLSSKLSLGAGGHIETDDVSTHLIVKEGSDELTPSSTIDFGETVDESYVREYLEEVELAEGEANITEGILGLSNTKGFQKLGFVMDSKPTVPGQSVYVGNVHFGIVYALEAPAEAFFKMTEEQNEAIGWATVDQLIHDDLFTDPEVPFEPWSALIIAQIKEVEAYILETFHGVKPAEDAGEFGRLGF